jgi:hypothetical protein
MHFAGRPLTKNFNSRIHQWIATHRVRQAAAVVGPVVGVGTTGRRRRVGGSRATQARHRQVPSTINGTSPWRSRPKTLPLGPTKSNER